MTDEFDEVVKCPMCGKDEKKYWINKNGKCFWCQYDEDEEKRKSREIKEAVETGEASSERGIICPYCGHIMEDDLCEYKDNETIQCYECDKEFNLNVEWTATYNTSVMNSVREKK